MDEKHYLTFNPTHREPKRVPLKISIRPLNESEYIAKKEQLNIRRDDG